MKYHMDRPTLVAAKMGSPTPFSSLRHSRPGFLPPKKAKKQSGAEKLLGWDAFAETIGMAEGSAGLLLGKVRPWLSEAEKEQQQYERATSETLRGES